MLQNDRMLLKNLQLIKVNLVRIWYLDLFVLATILDIVRGCCYHDACLCTIPAVSGLENEALPSFC